MNFDVVIVGAGPVGLTCANLLALYGHSVCVLEKEKKLFETPRAVAVDNESLRIWQSINLLKKMSPFFEEGKEGEEILTYRNAAGEKRLSLFQHGTPYGHAKGAVILQHEIDKVLLQGLNRFSDKVTVLFQHEVQEIKQDKKQISVVVENLGKKRQITGKYLIACDGGKSTIRKELGIKMKGFTYPQSWLIVDTIEERKKREGAEIFCMFQETFATIPLPKNHRRFEFFLKEKREADSFSIAEVNAFLKRSKKFKIKKVLRHLVYTFNARIAEKYREKAVFLAGDAAHVTPPFAGQGLATGLRDVANIGWKISECLKNHFSEELLDSYEKERLPHQKRMINLAVFLGKFMMPQSRLQAALNAVFLKVISWSPLLKNKLSLRGQNIQPIYTNGFIKKGNKAGHYWPQPVEIKNGKNLFWDDNLGSKFTVILSQSMATDFLSDSEIVLWKKRGAKFIELSKKEQSLFSDFLDTHKKHLLIIRPDRFVYRHDMI